MRIRLRVRESPRASFDWEHAGPSLCIGRADQCQLVFRGSIGEIVSLKHLQIELSPAGAVVNDLGSTNGTYLNGAPLTALAPLGVGDHLQLGLAGPRLEVLAIDLQVTHGPTRWRWTAPERPSLIAAGIAVATVICLILIFVAMRRQTDSPAMKEASAPAPIRESATASSEKPADQVIAVEGGGNPRTIGQTSKAATTDSENTDAGRSEAARPALSPGAAAPPSEKPPMPPAQPARQPVAVPTDKPPATEGIAALSSDHEILLRAVDDEWVRVPSGGPVYPGERFMALPGCRPRVTIGDLPVQLVGGTIASLAAAEDTEEARISLFSGRIVLPIAAGPASKIQLQAGDHLGTLEFDGEKTTLAIEVRRLLPDGSDPRQEASSTTVDFYLSDGRTTWVDAQGRREEISGPAHRSLGGRQSGKKSAEESPAWMEATELNPAERAASAEMEDVLKPDEPVAATFRNRVRHRLLENSVLAVQSLALIDDFEPLVPLLNDARHRMLWAAQIESLRAALARSPETATLVRVAFASVRGRELGDQLYRMLWGYTPQQLEQGALKELIDGLGAADEQLDFRVLSFWTLHHFTGLRLNYQPTAPEKQRRTAIERWQQKLESGLLVPQAL